jgi:hypothetical protein
MPIPIIAHGISEGISAIPYAWEVLKVAPWILLLSALKYYFGGARNTSERLLASKVVMVTVCAVLPNPSKKTPSPFPETNWLIPICHYREAHQE